MTAASNPNPAEGIFFVGGYDPAGHQVNVGLRLVNVQTDSSVSPPVVYGDIPVNVEVTTSGPTVQRVDAQSGDSVAGSIVDLATNATAISAGRMLTTPPSNQSINLAQVLGAALSASNPLFVAQSQNGAVLADINPEINISNIQQMILNGKGFSCSTGKVTAAANQAASWFSANASTKNKIIWSVRVTYTKANQLTDFRYINADDTNITGTGSTAIGNVINLKGGGAAPDAATAMHYNAGVTAPAVAEIGRASCRERV